MSLKVIKYIFVVIFVKSVFSQMPDMDSVYRNNSSLKVLDSLFSSVQGKKLDTSFTSTFGTAEAVNLDEMIYFARMKNPDLYSMEDRIEAYRVFGNSKSYLPDPIFAFELDELPSNFNFSKLGMINFFVSQMFPFPGKLEAERKSALKNADMLELEHHNMETEIINMIKMNYYDLYLINQKLKFNTDNQNLINTFTTAAESKYSVGKGMQQEVFKSQIEESRLLNEEKILEFQRNTIFDNLTRLTHLKINENTKINFKNIDIDYILNKQNFDFEKLDKNSLIEYAFQNRADLKALANKIMVGQINVDIAKLSKYPDLSVQLGYRVLPLEPHNAFEFMVGVNVPIAPWSAGKYDINIQKNELNKKSAEQDYESKRLEIKNQVDTIINSLISLRQTMFYYNDVMIPQTENSLKATQYSYENNRTSFLDLLDSYRMLNDVRNMFFESVTMYLKMIAELEKVTGMNFK